MLTRDRQGVVTLTRAHSSPGQVPLKPGQLGFLAPTADSTFSSCILASGVSFILAIYSALFPSLFIIGIIQLEHF